MPTFNVVKVIEAKSRGEILSSDDIRNFVRCIHEKVVDDSQIGAFLMAVKIKGMNPKETADLTLAMVEFSEKFDWSGYEWKDKVVDKHSTGGVGDKISHILAPTLAACGLKVPMISGRGLGITGGTIDKLEAIEGFSADLDIKDLGHILTDAGLFIIGQTDRMVPVDKCLYAIRDVTATIDSVPLITASILCKKKIEDLQILLMDIKYGKGTFMKTADEGEILAKSMIDTGKSLDMEVICVLDDMNSPLGYCMGNALEMAEVFRCLNGDIPCDIEEILNVMVYRILKSVDVSITEEEAQKRFKDVITNGQALNHLKMMLISQEVKKELAEDLCKHQLRSIEELLSIMKNKSAMETLILSEKDGYIESIDAEIVGTCVRDLKGGRYRKEDQLDYSVGVQLFSKEGQKVQKDKAWAKVYHTQPLTSNELKAINSAVSICDHQPDPKKRIAKVIM